jgi:hypothetical protein
MRIKELPQMKQSRMKIDQLRNFLFIKMRKGDKSGRQAHGLFSLAGE